MVSERLRFTNAPAIAREGRPKLTSGIEPARVVILGEEPHAAICMADQRLIWRADHSHSLSSSLIDGGNAPAPRIAPPLPCPPAAAAMDAFTTPA